MESSTMQSHHTYKPFDLAGQRFGRLTVIKESGVRTIYGKKCRFWLCMCDCGNETTVSTHDIRRGSTQSCGCLHNEKSRTNPIRHGMRHHPIYSVWLGIKDRCGNPNNAKFRYYGGAGITVCKRWVDSFAAFYEDMGPTYAPSLTLERIDGSLGYDKSNCRWATWTAQARNTSRNHRLTFRDETLCVAEWAERLGIHPDILYRRLYRGWSTERTLTEPPHRVQQDHRQNRNT